jgi:hypothetical protein
MVSGVSVQVSAPPLAAESASLIEEETLVMKFHTRGQRSEDRLKPESSASLRGCEIAVTGSQRLERRTQKPDTRHLVIADT